MGTVNRWIDRIVMNAMRRQKEAVADLLQPGQISHETDDDGMASISKEYLKDMMAVDFQECMGMLRHYDSVNWDLTKFTFGQVLVAIGACWTILGAEREKGETLWNVLHDGLSNYIVGSVLFLSACFVFLTLLAILKNRTYFVKMSRYLNEHRRNVLQEHPFGFANQSRMLDNPDFPPVIDMKSTQLLCVYLFVICLILLLFVALGCLFLNASHGLCIIIGLTSFICLICWGILRWIMKC